VSLERRYGPRAPGVKLSAPAASGVAQQVPPAARVPQEALALAEHALAVQLTGSGAGFHAVARLPATADEVAVSRAAACDASVSS
jgi:hypothetical protein